MTFWRIFVGRFAGPALAFAALLYITGVAIDPLVHALLDERRAENLAAASEGDVPAEIPEIDFRLDCSVCKVIPQVSHADPGGPISIIVFGAKILSPASESRTAAPAFLHPPSRGPPQLG